MALAATDLSEGPAALRRQIDLLDGSGGGIGRGIDKNRDRDRATAVTRINGGKGLSIGCVMCSMHAYIADRLPPM